MRTVPGLFLVAMTAGACSSMPGPDPMLTVGGTYQTAVTLVSSTCVGQTVEQHPTVVTHTPGSNALAFTHAGSTYPGVVTSTGAFTTPALIQIIGGITYSVSITGQFNLTSMDAQVRVDAGRQPPCTFTARWAGLKDGAPNVIP